VRGLYAWLRPEDLLVVDAGARIVRVNPPAATVACSPSGRNDR